MEIPIVLFVTFIVVTLFMIVIGMIRKVPMFMLLGGFLFMFWAIMTDSIIIDSFADGGASDTFHYNQLSSTGVIDICGNGGVGCNDIRGEYVSSTSSQLFGDTIDCIDVTLRKTGAPTGIGIVGVWDSSQSVNNPIRKQFGTFDPSTLSSGFSQFFTFCLPMGDTYTIQNQDVIGVRYDDGTAVDAVRILVTTTDAFDGTITFQRSKGDATNTWTSATANDVTGSFYLRGASDNIIDNVFVFDAYPKILFILMGSLFCIMGVLVFKFGD